MTIDLYPDIGLCLTSITMGFPQYSPPHDSYLPQQITADAFARHMIITK